MELGLEIGKLYNLNKIYLMFSMCITFFSLVITTTQVASSQ